MKACQTLSLNVFRYFVDVAEGVTAKGPHTKIEKTRSNIHITT